MTVKYEPLSVDKLTPMQREANRMALIEANLPFIRSLDSNTNPGSEKPLPLGKKRRIKTAKNYHSTPPHI